MADKRMTEEEGGGNVNAYKKGQGALVAALRG